MDQEYQKNEKFRELCYIGDMQLIKNFHKSNQPDLNSQNKINGWTSLHWACSRNNVELIEYLSEHGASKEIKNKDGKSPFEYIKVTNMQNDSEINASNFKNREITNQTSLIPNFIKNPQFHYVDKSLYDNEPINHSSELKSVKNISDTSKNQDWKATKFSQEMITVRIRSNFDQDFIEIDIDKQNLDFEVFKKMCLNELIDMNDNLKIEKIRKLPNILIRNTNDIKRLKNEQEIEFEFTKI